MRKFSFILAVAALSAAVLSIPTLFMACSSDPQPAAPVASDESVVERFAFDDPPWNHYGERAMPEAEAAGEYCTQGYWPCVDCSRVQLRAACKAKLETCLWYSDCYNIDSVVRIYDSSFTWAGWMHLRTDWQVYPTYDDPDSTWKFHVTASKICQDGCANCPATSAYQYTITKWEGVGTPGCAGFCGSCSYCQ